MHVAVPQPNGEPLVADWHPAVGPLRGAFVLAPGRGYHRDLPLLPSVASACAAVGFHALRFDWGFFTCDETPSDGLGREVQQLDAAWEWARERTSSGPLWVMGKSLGSRTALLWAREKQRPIAGLALCTLPLHPPDRPDLASLPPSSLDGLPCPIWIACGDRDPLAEPHALRTFVAACQSPPELCIVPGDHSFEDPQRDAVETQRNVDQVVQHLLAWALGPLPDRG